MPILIDGYNFLHVTGIFSEAVGPGALEKLHTALLDFLIATLDPSELPQTTIVFDARGRRAQSRRSHRYGDITVHYSARHEDADALLAELIRDHNTPRRLTVVSSDHQVQRAARRRRAKAIDSDVWHAELLRSRRDRRRTKNQPVDAKPAPPLAEHDAAWWLTQFAPELLQELANDSAPQTPAPVSGARPADSIPEPKLAADGDIPPRTGRIPPRPDDDVRDEEGIDYASLAAPFPPGYLADIQREFLAGQPEVPRPKSRAIPPAKRRPKRK